jgi:hypothetical protein
MAPKPKWESKLALAKQMREDDPDRSWTSISNEILGEGTHRDRESLRVYLSSKLSTREPQQKNFSAIRQSDGKLMDIHEWCRTYGIPAHQAKSYKLVTHTGVPYYNIQSNSGIDVSDSDLIDKITEAVSGMAPKYKKITRKKIKDGHLLVVDPADIHVGKLCSKLEVGVEYNQQIAIQRALDGVNGILQKSHGWNIDKVVLIAGNDILHTDTPRRTTTSNTPQDTDGMWYENFTNAQLLMIDIIETLMGVADVEVVYNPSNHDYMSGFMLIQSVKAWFRKCKNVTFKDDMAHRKYTTYGKNLIGCTHGDGAKTNDLPMLMVHEASEFWHNCKHRYIYTHHIHHKVSKDQMSVCIESMRSPSEADSWHHRNGYEHAPKGIDGFIHHPEHGQVARLSHIF